MSATFGALAAEAAAAPPDPIYRCPLDWWRLKRGLSQSRLARGLGVKAATLGRHFRDPADPRFVEAGLKLRQRARDYTGGAIGLDDWPRPVVARKEG